MIFDWFIISVLSFSLCLFLLLQVKQLVTADGTYATQSALSLGGEGVRKKADADKPILRRWLLDGDFFVAAALSSVLIKLVLRYQSLMSDGQKVYVVLYTSRKSCRAHVSLPIPAPPFPACFPTFVFALQEQSVDTIMPPVWSRRIVANFF